MNIETPLMAVRRMTGLSSTYLDAIYTSFVTMRGSGSGLQEDFSNGILTLSNYTRTARGTLTGDATSSATFVKTWGAIDATDDFIMVAVGECLGVTSTTFQVGAAGNVRVGIRTNAASVAAQTYDGVNTDTTTGTQTSDEVIGNKFVLVGVRDQGTDQYGYNYDISANEERWDLALGSTTTGATTPSADGGTLNDWAELYGVMMFKFAAGGLPSTWKEDMVAMARTLVIAKS